MNNFKSSLRLTIFIIAIASAASVMASDRGGPAVGGADASQFFLDPSWGRAAGAGLPLSSSNDCAGLWITSSPPWPSSSENLRDGSSVVVGATLGRCGALSSSQEPVSAVVAARGRLAAGQQGETSQSGFGASDARRREEGSGYPGLSG